MKKCRRLHQNHKLTYDTYDMSDDMSIIIKMCEGKPATLSMVYELYNAAKFDLIYALFVLDSIGIYGSCIFKFYTDYCYSNTDVFFDKIHEMSVNRDSILAVKKFLYIF